MKKISIKEYEGILARSASVSKTKKRAYQTKVIEFFGSSNKLWANVCETNLHLNGFQRFLMLLSLLFSMLNK